ncbi:MAG: hypothetical protein AAGB48_08370 [Planctomycetota bacterium]
MRATEYKGATIIAHPRNGTVRFAWRDLTGRIRYATTIRGAKISIDAEERIRERIERDAVSL